MERALAGIAPIISTTLMKQDVSGGLSLKVALESREFNVMVERSRSTGLLWCSL